MNEEEKIKKQVREGYAKIVTSDDCGCGPSLSCCGGPAQDTPKILSKKIGYSDDEMDTVPEGANLGLGCGNPTAFARIKEGDTVLDLGSGAGFDCFLAAKATGDTGKVIGVDMTHEMLAKARENAEKGGYNNVEFRLGEIEHLPVADNSVDVIISNCVINLVPNKDNVFKDAYRVLKPGGKLLVSDIVLEEELPSWILESVAAYVGCISGAVLKSEYLGGMENAGLTDVKILEETGFDIDCMANDPTAQALMEKMSKEELDNVANSVMSIRVEARK